jgi:hypothetical protein
MASPITSTDPDMASPANKRQAHDIVLLADPLGVGGTDVEEKPPSSYTHQRRDGHRQKFNSTAEMMAGAGVEALRVGMLASVRVLGRSLADSLHGFDANATPLVIAPSQEYDGRTCFYFRHNQ